MPVSRNRKNAPQRQKKALTPHYAGESVLARPGVFRNVSGQAPVSSSLCVIDDVQVPQACAELFLPRRYKVFYGGRGGGKSWSFADVLITEALKRHLSEQNDQNISRGQYRERTSFNSPLSRNVSRETL